MNACYETPGPELFGPVAHPVCDPDFPDDLLFEDIDSKPALVVMQFDGFSDALERLCWFIDNRESL